MPLHPQVIHTGDVDVEAPVAVDVGHRDAAFPSHRIRDAGAGGDVFEPEVAEVAIEVVRAQVRGEVEIDEAVAIDVARRHAAAIVEVQIVDDVHRGVFGEHVGECDSSSRTPDRFEERGHGWHATTAKRGQGGRKQKRQMSSQGAPV